MQLNKKRARHGPVGMLVLRRSAGRGRYASPHPQQTRADRVRAVVPQAGLEPALPHGKQILSLPRLPFRHWGTGRARNLAKRGAGSTRGTRLSPLVVRLCGFGRRRRAFQGVQGVQGDGSAKIGGADDLGARGVAALGRNDLARDRPAGTVSAQALDESPKGGFEGGGANSDGLVLNGATKRERVAHSGLLRGRTDVSPRRRSLFDRAASRPSP